MTDEKWQMLIENVKKNFSNVSISTEDLFAKTADGEVKQGTQDILQFENEQGRFRVVRQNKPVLLEKKMHFSHRQGDSARTEYKFSDTELSHKILVYKEDNMGEWQSLSTESMNIF
jgi:hypothetical protein